MYPNQTPTPDPRNTNDILDAIISESTKTYSDTTYTAAQPNLIQRYIASLVARNPITIILTILPITMLIGVSVLLSNQGQKAPIAEGDSSQASEEYAGSDTTGNNETPASENATESGNTGTQTQTPTGPDAVAAITNLSGNNPTTPKPPTNPVVVPTPPPAPTPPTPAPVTSTFGITSWNTYYGNSTTNVGNAAQELSGKGGDILAFQEVHQPSRRTALKSKMIDCSGCKYSGYVQNYSTDGSSPASLPIYWNKTRFSLLNSGYVKVADATGTDPNYISSKWITWVSLRDIATGRQFYVLNTHTVASIESGGQIGGDSGRVNNYKTHMNKLDTLIDDFQRSGTPIFITGDFNVNYRKDREVQSIYFPYYRTNKQGIKSNWQIFGPPSGGTQGSNDRVIDYVFSMTHGAVAPVSASKYGNRFGSDHYPVFYSLRLTK